MAKNENSGRRLKGYYGFQKKYPSRQGDRPIHESRKAKRRDRIKIAVFCVFLCCLFVGVFIFSKFCLNLSRRPLNENKIEAQQLITADNIGTVRAFHIDNSELSDFSEFEKLLENIKNNGFNAVMLDFKTSEGVLTYNSKTMSYKGDKEFNKIDSTVIDTIKEEGFLLLARVYCFEDTYAPQRLGAYVYEDAEKTKIWFDDSAIKGGNVWLDPTTARATNYICSLITEISDLGVDCIYLDSVEFPESREGAIPVYTEDDTTLNRNLVLMDFLDRAVRAAEGRPVILGMPTECAEGGNMEKWGGTLFDSPAHICSPVMEIPENANHIQFIENSYIVYNDKASNNFSTLKVIPTVKSTAVNEEFYKNLSSSKAESYIIIP